MKQLFSNKLRRHVLSIKSEYRGKFLNCSIRLVAQNSANSGHIQGVPENTRQADFFTPYMHPYEWTRPRL